MKLSMLKFKCATENSLPSNKKNNTNMGTLQNIGWYRKAPAISSCRAEIQARLMPQQIHGMPVTERNTQGHSIMAQKISRQIKDPRKSSFMPNFAGFFTVGCLRD